MSKVNDIIELAATLATQLSQDIRLASTRLEHIRLTARANEAVNLLHELQTLAGEQVNTDVQISEDGE
jgi:hypothetical protein